MKYVYSILMLAWFSGFSDPTNKNQLEDEDIARKLHHCIEENMKTNDKKVPFFIDYGKEHCELLNTLNHNTIHLFVARYYSPDTYTITKQESQHEVNYTVGRINLNSEKLHSYWDGYAKASQEEKQRILHCLIDRTHTDERMKGTCELDTE
ncbi:MAG: hypothetical protein ACON5A_05060 [Candidatus Comchoanobacterales bacterium]